MSAHAPIVLGGGMAGLAAAVKLAEAGLQPTLIEARPYLGGRVRSFVHEGTGDEIDNGQHLMMGCYTATFELLTMLGTRGHITLQRSLEVEFRDADGPADRLRASERLPAPLSVLVGMLRLRRLSARERAGLVRVGLAMRFARPRPDESARVYLRRLGQSERAMARLWDPIIIATLNTPPDQASAFLLVQVMRLAFLGGGESSRLALPSVGLSRLVEPAAAFIEGRGGRVLTGVTIAAIDRGPNGLRVLTREGDAFDAPRIVLALPERGARRVLEGMDDAVAVLPAVPFASSPIVSLYLWYDRPLAELPRFAALLGTNVQWMFNRRAIDARRNDAAPGLLSCTISAAFEESRADGGEIVAVADRELRGAFPEMAGAVLVDALVVKEKQATFAATPAVEALRPAERTAIPGLYLAGDWTNTGLPATIEGAVRSGFAAARSLMEDVSVSSGGAAIRG